MNNNQILDEDITQKPSSDCWKGARYIGYGFASLVSVSAITWLMRWAITKEVEPQMDVWILLPLFTLALFMFFNIAGFMISIDYFLTGNSTRDKVAGFVSLLLNVAPIGSLVYYMSNT